VFCTKVNRAGCVDLKRAAKHLDRIVMARLSGRFRVQASPRLVSGLRGSRHDAENYDYFGPQEPSGALPDSEPTPIATGCDTMPL
jgi:hypothetical protein